MGLWPALPLAPRASEGLGPGTIHLTLDTKASAIQAAPGDVTNGADSAADSSGGSSCTKRRRGPSAACDTSKA